MSVIITCFSLLLTINHGSLIDHEVDLDQLPEYVVITSEGTSSSITISIDHRRSRFDKALESLEDYLSHRRKRAVRNQSELLTTMSEIGFDYINAYQLGTEHTVNVVFRKKKEFRN